MNINDKYPFLNTIFQLRTKEEIILYDKMLATDEQELLLVRDFLEEEYRNESLGYPFKAPPFEGTAAVWASRTLYTLCQLVLYREQQETEVPALLPAYEEALTPSAVLSADLCLRFLPQVLTEAKHIDPDDILVGITAGIMNTWHYSGIGSPLQKEPDDIVSLFTDPCMAQLYTDRVMQKNDQQRARLPMVSDHIKGVVGMHQQYFKRR